MTTESLEKHMSLPQIKTGEWKTLELGITELINTESRYISMCMLSSNLKIIPFPQESSKAVTHRELPHASQTRHTHRCL